MRQYLDDERDDHDRHEREHDHQNGRLRRHRPLVLAHDNPPVLS